MGFMARVYFDEEEKASINIFRDSSPLTLMRNKVVT